MASIEQAIAKIRSFQTLPTGWYCGDGGPIGFDMRERAFRVVRLATKYGIRRADAFPGADGQISVSFYDGNRTLAIRMEVDETYSSIEDISNKVITDFYELSEAEATQKLWEFSQANRILSALSTSGFGNQSKIDSVMLHLLALQQQKEAGMGEVGMFFEQPIGNAPARRAALR